VIPVLICVVCVAVQIVAAEKAAQQPPRLGKHKFEALPPPVMTTDEITGSLRQIQPCFLVTQDRFKSLQKRGLIEPRRPVAPKKAKTVTYMPGVRREKAEHGQEELVAARKARKLLAKKSKEVEAVTEGW
jgi:nucleolar protein 53